MGVGGRPLDAECPDGHDGHKHSYSADGPAGQVSRTIRFRSIDHAVVPLAHGGLLWIDTASGQ